MNLPVVTHLIGGVGGRRWCAWAEDDATLWSYGWTERSAERAVKHPPRRGTRKIENRRLPSCYDYSPRLFCPGCGFRVSFAHSGSSGSNRATEYAVSVSCDSCGWAASFSTLNGSGDPYERLQADAVAHVEQADTLVPRCTHPGERGSGVTRSSRCRECRAALLSMLAIPVGRKL